MIGTDLQNELINNNSMKYIVDDNYTGTPPLSLHCFQNVRYMLFDGVFFLSFVFFFYAKCVCLANRLQVYSLHQKFQ